jgi:hypothetical protein
VKDLTMSGVLESTHPGQRVSAMDPHTQIAAELEQVVILTRLTFGDR